MQLELPTFDPSTITDTRELVNVFFNDGFTRQRKESAQLNREVAKQVRDGLVEDVKMYLPLRKETFAGPNHEQGYNLRYMFTELFTFQPWDLKDQHSISACIGDRNSGVQRLYSHGSYSCYFPIAYHLRKLTARSFSITYFIHHFDRATAERWDCTQSPSRRSVVHLIFRQSGTLFNLDTRDSFVEYTQIVQSQTLPVRVKARIGIREEFNHNYAGHKMMLETMHPTLLKTMWQALKNPAYVDAYTNTYSKALMRITSSMSVPLREDFALALADKNAQNTFLFSLIVKAMGSASARLEEEAFEYFYLNCGLLRDLFSDKECLRTYFEFDVFVSSSSARQNMDKLRFSMIPFWQETNIGKLLDDAFVVMFGHSVSVTRSQVIFGSFPQGPWSTRKTFEFIRDHLIPDPISNVKRTYLIDGWLPPVAFWYAQNHTSKIDRSGMYLFTGPLFVTTIVNMFYRLYHSLFSDSLKDIEKVYPASHILNICMAYCHRHCMIDEGEDLTAEVFPVDRNAYSHNSVTPFNSATSILRMMGTFSSIEKQRRFFQQMFPPLHVWHEHVVANVDKEVAQYILQHSYSSHSPETIKALLPATSIVNDTVNMQTQFADFISKGKADGSEIHWRKCRTIGELHDEISTALNAVKYPNYTRKNTIYEPIQGMKIEIPGEKIVTCVAPQDTQMVRDWGSKQAHCIGSYAEQVNDMSKILLGVAHENGTWLGHMQLTATVVPVADLPASGATDNQGGYYHNQINEKPDYAKGRVFRWRVSQFYAARNAGIPAEIKMPILTALFDVLHDAERAKVDAAKKEQKKQPDTLVGTEVSAELVSA